MQAPYTEWTRVVTFPYGTVVYDLDVSPDGTKLVAAFGEIDGKMDVRVFRAEALLKGDDAPRTTRFDFGQSVPSSFVFSPDGRFVYGTSYLTGVSNVFRYELATGETEAVSNTETGFFRPIPARRRPARGVPLHRAGAGARRASRARPSRTRRRSRFSASGWPRSSRWCGRGSPARRRRSRGRRCRRRTASYRLAGGLKSESFYPIVQGYKDSAAVGMRWNLSDRLQLNRLSLVGQLQPRHGPAVRANGCTCARTTSATTGGPRPSLNDADFYDLFGPTKTGRKGYGVSVGAQVDAALRRAAAPGVRRRGRVFG